MSADTADCSLRHPHCLPLICRATPHVRSDALDVTKAEVTESLKQRRRQISGGFTSFGKQAAERKEKAAQAAAQARRRGSVALTAASQQAAAAAAAASQKLELAYETTVSPRASSARAGTSKQVGTLSQPTDPKRQPSAAIQPAVARSLFTVFCGCILADRSRATVGK